MVLSQKMFLFVCLWGLVTSASSRKLKKKIIEKQYNCDWSGIKNKTECLTMMSHPVMQQSFRFIQEATDEELKDARRSMKIRLKRFVQGRAHEEGVWSLSPYQRKMIFNKNLFPQFISEIHCKYMGCVNPDIDRNFDPDGSVTNRLISRPLRAGVPMYRIKRDRVTGIEERSFTVGCTCVKPINY
ncbi:uncharacterized protein LOC143470100 [Clavelina lepadiformis]|uniref:uncharacterized protein LOC143470100 n=1 Tax=Clavelina lepadiformis TaxID=159417 RepID=UPI0040433F65